MEKAGTFPVGPRAQCQVVRPGVLPAFRASQKGVGPSGHSEIWRSSLRLLFGEKPLIRRTGVHREHFRSGVADSGQSLRSRIDAIARPAALLGIARDIAERPIFRQ